MAASTAEEAHMLLRSGRERRTEVAGGGETRRLRVSPDETGRKPRDVCRPEWFARGGAHARMPLAAGRRRKTL